MICSKCGNQISEGETFCSKCGNPVNGTVNNQQAAPAPAPVKKNSALKIILIIIIGLVVLGGIVALLFFTLFSKVLNTGDKLECTSPTGNLTLSFKDEELIGYVATGDITFDLTEGKATNKKYGEVKYKEIINKWFVTNVGGTCSDNGKKLDIVKETNEDKLVCNSSIGGIVLTFADNEISDYKTSGEITFDIESQQIAMKQIGVKQYKESFNDWFINNTDGNCYDNNVKMDDSNRTNFETEESLREKVDAANKKAVANSAQAAIDAATIAYAADAQNSTKKFVTPSSDYNTYCVDIKELEKAAFLDLKGYNYAGSIKIVIDYHGIVSYYAYIAETSRGLYIDGLKASELSSDKVTTTPVSDISTCGDPLQRMTTLS